MLQKNKGFIQAFFKHVHVEKKVNEPGVCFFPMYILKKTHNYVNRKRTNLCTTAPRDNILKHLHHVELAERIEDIVATLVVAGFAVVKTEHCHQLEHSLAEVQALGHVEIKAHDDGLYRLWRVQNIVHTHPDWWMFAWV